MGATNKGKKKLSKTIGELVHSEISPTLIETIIKDANMEHRLGIQKTHALCMNRQLQLRKEKNIHRHCLFYLHSIFDFCTWLWFIWSQFNYSQNRLIFQPP